MMDHRILIAAVVGLVLVAFGGFYYALSPRPGDVSVPPPPAQATAAAPAVPQQEVPPAPPPQATPASIEAEIARSDHAELQALLKQHFAEEYQDLIAVAVRRRNEGVPQDKAGEEVFARFQEMMRSKLNFAAAASLPTIDKLAQNEISLFHALGTEGAAFCLKVLGRNSTAATDPLPDGIRKMMRLGTLYRFQAIVEGMPQFKPVQPLQPEELTAFEAALNRNGVKLDDVRSGAFLDSEGNEGGKPCLMIEKLYTIIAGLPDETRRKLYAGMFFLGRDK